MNNLRFISIGNRLKTLGVTIVFLGTVLVHLPVVKAEQSIFTGQVTAASGSAQYRDTNTILWQNITLGQTISEGDHVRTGGDGQIKVEFTNGNLLFLKPNSEINVEKLAIDPDSGKNESVFDVIEASIKAEVKDRKHLKTFEVKTPTAVAGVRGTILYVNSKKDFTEVFVEQGKAFLRNTISDRRQELNAGLATTTDSQGEIAKPFVPPPEKMQEFQGAWEPLPPVPGSEDPNAPPPPPEGDKSAEGTQEEGTQLPGTNGPFPYSMFFPPPNEYMLDQQNFNDIIHNAFFDRFFSQQVALTDYTSTTLPGDNDSDGITDNIDTDDDNDWLLDDDEINKFHTSAINKDSDNDGLTDWEEAVIQHSNPNLADQDSDGVSDLNDVFPALSSLSDNRAAIRTKRYNQVAGISGLRTEISNMLGDATERQKDYLMDRISDAQTHKVLKDHLGNWVRTEEYVFRPISNQVDVQLITYSPSGGWTSMLWSTTFASSLSGMSSTQIRDLPWDKFLSLTPNYGATLPAVVPTNTSVKFEHQGSPDSFENFRGFASPIFTSNWTQTATSTASFNGGPFEAYTISATSPSNPNSFHYTQSPSSAVDFFTIHIIDDNGSYAPGSFSWNDLFGVLATNLPGFNSIGNNNVEINLSFNSNSWTVIYVPIRSLTWRGTSDWYAPLSW